MSSFVPKEDADRIRVPESWILDPPPHLIPALTYDEGLAAIRDSVSGVRVWKNKWGDEWGNTSFWSRQVKTIIYMMGVTNAGKTTLIDKLVEQDSRIGAVQVGKEFRRRYPPGHFAGQGAPDHTEEEALRIYSELLDLAKDKQIVLVDGQPRRMSQVPLVIEGAHKAGFNNQHALWLWEPDEVLLERILLRFPGDSLPERQGRELCHQRLVNDKKDLYPVLWHMTRAGVPFTTIVPSKEDALAVIFGEMS